MDKRHKFFLTDFVRLSAIDLKATLNLKLFTSDQFTHKAVGDMINTSTLKTLENEIGSEDFLEVAALFLVEMDDAIESLTRAQSASEIGATLHFLKGASLNLGLTDFAEICIAGERNAKSGNAEAIDRGAILNTYHSSQKALQDYLKNLGIER
ncbi:Hpt domain-containing protein [Celeribacter marinus]|uniref:Hpt domain-containing protein n=1 Tax=Celeribacter marinus TaxID=1397108 RepID=UPI003F6BC77C